MNGKELLQTALRYEMSMSFLNDLLNNGKLKKDEFDRAAKFVADKYDIDNVEIELGKLRYANLQIKGPVSNEKLVEKSAEEKSEVQYVSLTDIAKKFSDNTPTYVIQSWMRSRNILEFLKLWEQRHNANFIVEEYKTLIDKLNSGLLPRLLNTVGDVYWCYGQINKAREKRRYLYSSAVGLRVYDVVRSRV